MKIRRNSNETHSKKDDDNVRQFKDINGNVSSDQRSNSINLTKYDKCAISK